MENNRTIPEYEMTSGESFVFGKGFLDTRHKFSWNPDDSKNAINPHMLIVGGSGAGKTRLLRKIIQYLQNRGKQVYVIDFHGDIKTEGETVFRFTARNSEYGLNPFEFEHDPDNGGIEVQTRILTSTFKRSFIKNLGDRQRSVLMQFIRDCYAYVGIYDKDVSTWNNPIPTIETFKDLYVAINARINLNEANDYYSQVQTLIKLRQTYLEEVDESQKSKTLEKIDKKFGDFENYNKMFYNFLTKGEYENIFNTNVGDLDISWYLDKENAKTFKSLAPYIKDIHSSPVFNENKPPKRRGVVRYDISGFTNVDEPSEAIFFADVIAQRIFRSAKMRGEYRESGKPGVADIFIVVDESKLILPTGQDKDNPYIILNRIVTEARKYGLGWIGVSQRPSHFPPEMTSSIGTKVVLQINKGDISNAVRCLGVQNAESFHHLKTKGTALIGQIGKDFYPVALPWVEI